MPAILETAPDSAAQQRWPMMLDQALDALPTLPPASSKKQGAAPRHALVGHSMGGYIALQAAARHMDTIGDVVLIDSPIPVGWRANVLTFAHNLWSRAFNEVGAEYPDITREYHHVADQWNSADSVLQPFVQQARQGLARIGGSGRAIGQ